MSGIFVDTGAWFARFVPTDPDHPAAKVWLDRNTSPLITTDYIVDELLTLLKVRGEYQRALEIGPNLFGARCATWNGSRPPMWTRHGGSFPAITTRSGASPIASAAW